MRVPGGKGSLYRQLINLMPVHDVYIETHLGSGAVLRAKAPAKRNIGIEIDPDVLKHWIRLDSPHVEIVQGDAMDFLRTFTFSGKELLYCDPPYLPSTRRRNRIYRFDYGPEHHEALLDVLLSIPAMVMVSGYDSELYQQRLAAWRRFEFLTGSHGMSRREIVWTNFDPPVVPHDIRYIGQDFREREQIRRRHSRLTRKLEALPAAERAMLLNWLRERFGPELGVTQ